MSLPVLFSLWIELTQFRLWLGWPEADDVIHNTLGAVLGLGIYPLSVSYAVPLLSVYKDAVLDWIRKP